MRIRGLLVLGLAALSTSMAGAESSITLDQVARIAAEQATWNTFDGVWEGTVSTSSPDGERPAPDWPLHIQVDGLKLVFIVRDKSGKPILDVRRPVDHINEKLGIFLDVEMTKGNYQGKYKIAVMRRARDAAMISVERWYPPPFWPWQYQQVTIWSGTVKRISVASKPVRASAH
jgi:hypothetical protein